MSLYLTYICVVLFGLADVARGQFHIIKDYNKHEHDIKEMKAELRQLHKVMRTVLRRIGEYSTHSSLQNY